MSMSDIEEHFTRPHKLIFNMFHYIFDDIINYYVIYYYYYQC